MSDRVHDFPDSRISKSRALSYWDSIPATDNGVLGGYGSISDKDLAMSSHFLASLNSYDHRLASSFSRALDCGAGIGRVSLGVLSQNCSIIDIVEPVEKFTSSSQINTLRSLNVLGDIYNVGLESFLPTHRYDLVWNQWCLGHLTDAQLVEHLCRCAKTLSTGGLIIVKENMTRSYQGEDIFDEVDNSVTRSESKWVSLFVDANLKVTASELQSDFPKELLPVRIWALQP